MFEIKPVLFKHVMYYKVKTLSKKKKNKIIYREGEKSQRYLYRLFEMRLYIMVFMPYLCIYYANLLHLSTSCLYTINTNINLFLEIFFFFALNT